MAKFRVPVVYQMYGHILVDASSKEEAIEKACNGNYPLPADGEYLDESWQVDDTDDGAYIVEVTDDSQATDESAQQDEGQVYYVTYRIDGRLPLEVRAQNVEEALEKAKYAYWDADIGDVDPIEDDPVTVEDEKGNIVWEA